MGTFRRSQWDRSSHFKHICCDGSAPTCWVDPASVATTHSSLSVPCHRSLSLITPLLHMARRCACCKVYVHNLPCFSTLANSICDSAPQRSQWPRPDLWICVSSLHVNPPCQRALVWCVRHEDSNEIVCFQEKLHLALDAHILE